MTKGILIYYVTEGPVWGSDIYDDDVWQVKAQVSKDGGKTVESMIFSFGEEEHAIEFKYDVNHQMEPLEIGEEDE